MNKIARFLTLVLVCALSFAFLPARTSSNAQEEVTLEF